MGLVQSFELSVDLSSVESSNPRPFKLTSLQPYARNARTHNKQQIKMIAGSIKAFGSTNPILTDQNNTIVTGHGRLEAAKLIGMPKVPAIRLENLSPEQIRAYILADNKLAEKAGWDGSILAIEQQHLLTVDLGFEVTVTGFEVPEIDLLVGHAATACEPEPEPGAYPKYVSISEMADDV
jgi:ParB-like chromosome segregation protein Spo0J